MKRTCHICGNEATGYASIWTAKTGTRWYCHGDDDETPTCYERGTWEPSADDEPPTPFETDIMLKLASERTQG